MVTSEAVNTTSARNDPPRSYLYNDAKFILKYISVKIYFETMTDIEACVAMTTCILQIVFLATNQLLITPYWVKYYSKIT